MRRCIKKGKEMGIIKTIWNNKWILRSIIHTVYFNFHYFPFRTAIKLPVLLYKPHLLQCKGIVKIEGNVHFGMIKLGCYNVPLYPNTGITWQNNGGIVTFSGKCTIGNSSCISVGKAGNIFFGNDFCASASFKCVSYNNIHFSDRVRFGYDAIVLDTDFHKMKKLNGGYTRGFGSIYIGNNNWFGLNCIVLKNSFTPDYCTFSAASVIRETIEKDCIYSIFDSNPTLSRRWTGLYRDIDDDIIEYTEQR